MSAASDLLDQFEAAVWQASQATDADGKPCQLLEPARVAEIVAAARSYAKALVRLSREPKAAAPKKPPAVHFEARRGRPACRPFDLATGGWTTANVPGGVTCGHCRKTQAWLDAGGAR